MDYKIRLATLEDCKALSIIKQKMWDETYRGIYIDEIIDHFNYEETEETFAKIINNKDISLYVVEIEDSIAAFMSVGKPLYKFKNYEQEIGLLYIRKAFQKKGIGKALFNLAKQEIKDNGYNCFIVSCNKYNYNAKGFYEKLGGKVIHEDQDADIENKRFIQTKYLYNIN